MLNYKHAYHAGNHADVLKHVCLIYFIKLNIHVLIHQHDFQHEKNVCN